MSPSPKNWGGVNDFFWKFPQVFINFWRNFQKLPTKKNKISEDWRIISHTHSRKPCFNPLLRTRSHVEDDTGIVVGVLIFGSYRFHTCLQNLKHHNKCYRKVQWTNEYWLSFTPLERTGVYNNSFFRWFICVVGVALYLYFTLKK